MLEPAKYAKPERERRFVLSEIPAAATDAQEILDLYIVGTRMRLRTVSSDDGIAYKLGQKVRPNPEEPGLVMHTTLYLSRSEYEVLAVLPCRRLRKTRRHVALADGPLSVDAFHDGLVGLILAEVDLGDQGEPGRMFDPPRYCVAEVSSDERFTGGRLAATDRAAMVEVLEAVSGLRLPA
jgi:CYTH domain-containing protein